MKLISLSLTNFRQFYGSHSITFSTDEKQNITVLHGENGAGKTSLLNAFKWCFYARTDFDTGEDNLLNEQAIAAAEEDKQIPLAVTVEFDHDDQRYTAVRTLSFKKGKGMNVEPIGGPVLELTWTDLSGRYEKSRNPESQMSQILPVKMHSYFFFNGERIEKLSYASASHEIREAIRTLMGLEIVERARTHLSGKVRKHFNKQIKDGASSDLQHAIDEEDALDDAIKDAEQNIETERDNIQQFDEDIQFISNRLKAIATTVNLEKERETIEKQLDEIKVTLLVDLRAKLTALVSERGFLPFVQPVAWIVWQLLDDRRAKGELPYQIKQQFIDDLLKKEQCICGGVLKAGTKAYDSVASFGKAATVAGVEEAFINTSVALRQVEWAQDELFDRLREGLKTRATLSAEMNDLTGRLDDISKTLKESTSEDVVALENKRAALHSRRDECVSRKGHLVGKLEEQRKELDRVVNERKDLEQRSGKADLAKQRRAITEECARVLSELHEALARRTKDQLSKQVNHTFQRILQKDYWAEIDDDYSLQVFKKIPGHGPQAVHEKSTGESQVTSLSFIGSIVSLAKEQHAKERQFFRGGVFPIVMDSPFGSLDPTYRTLIARYIPQLADQIVLLASGTQWKDEVEAECQARVGKHISLIYHAPEVGKNKASHFVRHGAEFEHTEFEEGYHG